MSALENLLLRPLYLLKEAEKRLESEGERDSVLKDLLFAKLSVGNYHLEDFPKRLGKVQSEEDAVSHFLARAMYVRDVEPALYMEELKGTRGSGFKHPLDCAEGDFFCLSRKYLSCQEALVYLGIALGMAMSWRLMESQVHREVVLTLQDLHRTIGKDTEGYLPSEIVESREISFHMEKTFEKAEDEYERLEALLRFLKRIRLEVSMQGVPEESYPLDRLLTLIKDVEDEELRNWLVLEFAYACERVCLESSYELLEDEELRDLPNSDNVEGKRKVVLESLYELLSEAVDYFIHRSNLTHIKMPELLYKTARMALVLEKYEEAERLARELLQMVEKNSAKYYDGLGVVADVCRSTGRKEEWMKLARILLPRKSQEELEHLWQSERFFEKEPYYYNLWWEEDLI